MFRGRVGESQLQGYPQGWSYSANWAIIHVVDIKVKPMLLDVLHTNKDRIEALGSQYGARRIRVFGSVARREVRPDSDVDFLVDFPRGYDMFAQRLALADQLEILLARLCRSYGPIH